MAKPTLGGITLEGVSRITPSKVANIIPLPTPTQGSTATILFDLLGVVKTITIQGLHGAEVDVLKSFVDSVDRLITGNQNELPQKTVFTSDQTGAITAMVIELQPTFNVPGNNVDYIIKIIEGLYG